MKNIKKMIPALIIAIALLLGAFALAQPVTDQTTAENIALEAAGVARGDASMLPTETETEHGQSVYDVEFTCGDFEYDYWVSASDGSIIKQSWELTGKKTLDLAAAQDANADAIGETKALEAAISDAGLTSDRVTSGLIELDTDDQLRLYEVKFYTEDAEYEYEIDAVSGAVCGVGIERFASGEAVRPGQSYDKTATAAVQSVAGEGARDAALKDAGLNATDVRFTKTKTDREDGRQVYEIEFVKDNVEYEYEIDAETGEILEKSRETFKTDSQTGSGNYVGVDRAKSAALAGAGLSASDVSFEKAKLEKDDGVNKYEVEFVSGGVEYDYEIDAETGEILEQQTERDNDRDDDRDDDDDDDDDDDRYERDDDDDDDDD